jgi:signal peptidase II
MMQLPLRKPALHRLLWLLVAIVVIGDQLSKAYFVYRLGDHATGAQAQAGFWQFLPEYFSLWGKMGGMGAVSQHYAPFHPYIAVWEPWVRFSLTTNTGAAWSIFEGNSFALSFVSLAMAILLYNAWWRWFRANHGMTWALGAIIGGALGNAADRFRLKEVVDFVATKIPYIGRIFPKLGDPYDFPIFNVADACAVCGTIALAAYLILADLHGLRRPNQASRQTAGAAFTPYPAGLDVSTEALEQLKHAAATAPRVTTVGLTRHIGLAPASATEDVNGDGG